MIRSLAIVLLVLAMESGTPAAPSYNHQHNNGGATAWTTTGTTTTTPPHRHHTTTATKQPSRRTSQRTNIKIQELSLLLRWTSEMNRRLQAAATEDEYDDDDDDVFSSAIQQQQQQQHGDTASAVVTDPLRGGETSPYRIPTAFVASTRSNSNKGNKPGALSSDKFENLTIFHAKTPRTGRRGVARWGPDLDIYLHKLAELLEVKEGSIEWVLALLYLDRACSVESPRSNGIPASPFLGPRTVHRLVLAALVLAVRAARAGDDQQQGAVLMNQYYSRLSSAFGIPNQHLSLMVDWMHGALGDLGLFVATYQVQEFAEKWNLKFGYHNEEIEPNARHPQPLSHAPPQDERQQFSEAMALQQAESSQTSYSQGGHSYHPNNQYQRSSVLHA